jgi:hypothetical protein
MKRVTRWALLTIAAAGCGNEVTTTGPGGSGGDASTSGTTSASTSSAGGASTTASTTTSTTSSTGSGSAADECTTNADCPPDGTCIELEPGGRLVCQYPVVEATTCTEPGLDACCTTADCMGPGEKCLGTPLLQFCAGIVQQPHNECAADQCASNADCAADEICAPAGTLGGKIAFCLRAQCHGTICGQESITDCAVLHDPCCGAPVGLYCVGECLTNADCTDGYCSLDPDTQRSKCFPGAAPCPG